MTTIKIRGTEYEPKLFTESDIIVLTQVSDQASLLDRYQQWQDAASSILRKIFPGLPIEFVSPGIVNLYLTEILAIAAQLQKHLLSDPAYLATLQDFEGLPVSAGVKEQLRTAVTVLQSGQITTDPIVSIEPAIAPPANTELLQQIEALILQNRPKPQGFAL